MNITGFLWGTRAARMATVAVGLATGIFAFITAAHTAWPIVDPYILAHRGYVLEHVGGTDTKVNELLIWKSEDTKNRIAADLGGWTIQLQKEQDPQTKRLI